MLRKEDQWLENGYDKKPFS